MNSSLRPIVLSSFMDSNSTPRNILPDRLLWQFRRLRLMRRIPGFRAHWDTYATRDCEFSENNRLSMKTWLVQTGLGRYSYIAGAKAGYATIGAFCSIGPEAIIGGLGSHPTNFLSTHPAFFSVRMQAGKTFVNHNLFEELKHTSIGNDVWVGTRAIILDGVNVSDGAVIAAGALVTKDVPPYAIVAGVPARIIKFRFSDFAISELLRWKWWDLPEAVLAKLASQFSGIDTWTRSDFKKYIELSRNLLQ